MTSSLEILLMLKPVYNQFQDSGDETVLIHTHLYQLDCVLSLHVLKQDEG